MYQRWPMSFGMTNEIYKHEVFKNNLIISSQDLLMYLSQNTSTHNCFTFIWSSRHLITERLISLLWIILLIIPLNTIIRLLIANYNIIYIVQAIITRWSGELHCMRPFTKAINRFTIYIQSEIYNSDSYILSVAHADV